MTTPFQKMLHSLSFNLTEDNEGEDVHRNRYVLEPTIFSKEFIKPEIALPSELPENPFGGPPPPGMVPVPCADDPTTICGWDANGDGIADYGYENILVIINGQVLQFLAYTLETPDGHTVAWVVNHGWTVCGWTADGDLMVFPGMTYVSGGQYGLPYVGEGAYVMILGDRIWVCLGDPFGGDTIWVDITANPPMFWSPQEGQTQGGYHGWLASIGIQMEDGQVPLVPFLGPEGPVWVPGQGWVGDWYEEGQNPSLTVGVSVNPYGEWWVGANVNIPFGQEESLTDANLKSLIRQSWMIYLQYWRQTHPDCVGDECYPPKGQWPPWWTPGGGLDDDFLAGDDTHDHHG